ncbi:MAG TPA: hypothetical protein ENK55_05415 [Actinobacteria bacterium]|nr:hypothetical protein [Actinomycetota bacterium]
MTTPTKHERRIVIRPPLSLAGTTRDENRKLIREWWAELDAAEDEGRPVANVFVMGSMAEILRTFDMPIAFPEMTSLQTAVRGRSLEYITTAEDAGYSPDICGYVKADVGVHLQGRDHPMGRLPVPSLVVATNLCNTYIKWGEIWERMYDCPVFVFDIPGWRGSGFETKPSSGTFRDDVRYVEAQVRELIALCEEVTGKRFDIDRFRETLAEVNELSRLFQEVLELNQHRPAPFNALTEGINLMGIVNAYRGSPKGTRFLEIAKAEFAERIDSGVGAVPDERFRLLLVGTACYSNFRDFAGLFEDWQGVFAHSDYMSFAGGALDRGVHYDLDRPVESMAEQMVLTTQEAMGGMFWGQDWLTEVVRDWEIDGIVFHGVKSCRTVSTGLPDEREWLLRRRDIPGLFIQSDLVDPRLWSAAQLKNRIDAFFESLESRRAIGARR